MEITSRAWNNYITRLRRLSDKAADLLARRIAGVDFDTLTYDERMEIIDYAFGLVTKYGEGASALACEMYDAAARLQEAMVPAAVPAETATYAEVAKAVNGTIKTRNVEMISGSAGRLVKMAGVDTVMDNAIRDGAEWAWIPRGDTCAFCIMLASQGWQKASRKAMRNGHAEHIHANCDCTYAVRFRDDLDVEGYHHEEYENMYYNTDPNAVNPKQRINAMRRAFYAENKEEINAQKRSAYAKRQELEASRAEETDVN